MDRWKVSTAVLGGVFAALIAGGSVESALGQPVKIPSGSVPAPGKGPERIGPTPAPSAAPSADPGDDDKKGTPQERAAKLMESARAKVVKMKADPGRRKEKALKHIDEAIAETKAIPAVQP